MRAPYSLVMLRSAACLALLLAVPACKRDGIASASLGAGSGANAQAVVTAKSGNVQLLRASDGTVAEAKVGDRLSSKDALRTEMGEADVAVEGVRVRLHESSCLELKQIGNKAPRARVRARPKSEVAKS